MPFRLGGVSRRGRRGIRRAAGTRTRKPSENFHTSQLGVLIENENACQSARDLRQRQLRRTRADDRFVGDGAITYGLQGLWRK